MMCRLDQGGSQAHSLLQRVHNLPTSEGGVVLQVAAMRLLFTYVEKLVALKASACLPIPSDLAVVLGWWGEWAQFGMSFALSCHLNLTCTTPHQQSAVYSLHHHHMLPS